MAYKIVVSEHANNDIKGIYEYIANTLLVPNTAREIVHGLLRCINSLELFPDRHPIYHEEPWKTKEIRFITFKNYIVFYLIDNHDQRVQIVRVIYGGRDLQGEASRQ